VARLHIFGNNADVSTSFETLWDEGDAHTYQSAAAVMKISSSDAGDTQDYFVWGLGAGGVQLSETVTAVGQTETALTNSFLRVFGVKNVGTTVNAGDVYIYEDDTVTSGVPQTQGKIHAKALAGANISHSGFATLGLNSTARLNRLHISSPTDTIVSVRVLARPDGGVWEELLLTHVYRQNATLEFGDMAALAALTDIEIQAKGAASAVVAAHAEFILS